MSGLQKFTRNFLTSLKFHCGNSDCPRSAIKDEKSDQTEPMTYKDALRHNMCCLHENYFCPFNCHLVDACEYSDKFKSQKLIMGYEMREHLKVCPEAEVNCSKCSLPVKQRYLESHDCFEDLKARVLQQNQRIMQLKQKHGLEFDRSKAKCR